jgi:serine/threonine-protein kinase
MSERELAPGTAFGARHTIVDVLGSGGMAVVYRARDARSGRDVALKVLKRGPRLAERWARFEREGQVAATLCHPGIVALLSTGTVEGVPFLEYELVEGHRSLARAFDDLDLRGRVAALLEGADALAHAHARGVVHRDVKPSNLLVDGAGRVRVTDFGLAHLDGFERLTATGHTIGTPAYMAPEQWSSHHEHLGPHTDVWALGAILYLALTGRRPFEERNPAQLLTRLLAGPPAAPRTLVPDVPPALEEVCLRALRREPGERPRDAAAFARELRAAPGA